MLYWIHWVVCECSILCCIAYFAFQRCFFWHLNNLKARNQHYFWKTYKKIYIKYGRCALKKTKKNTKIWTWYHVCLVITILDTKFRKLRLRCNRNSNRWVCGFESIATVKPIETFRCSYSVMSAIFPVSWDTCILHHCANIQKIADCSNCVAINK